MSGAPRPGGGYGNGYGSYARSHAGNSGRGGTDGGRDVRRNERGQEQGRGAHAAYRGHDDFSRRPPPPPARAPERDIERSRDNRQVPSSDRHHELNKPKHDSDDRGYGPGTRKLDDILRVIERDWTFMIDEACVPVKVALQLSDSSSLGMAHKYASFKEIHQDLQYALQAIVNDHHQGFNSSIGAFHTIMRSITTSQSKVRELRDSLLKAKEDLSTSKPEVKNMVDNSQKYDAMLQTLQSIEQLQVVPEKLEVRISEKKFLSAVELLAESLKRIREPYMMEIGALSDLRTYLGIQETSLGAILIEELHNHLYLKSLYCNDRWKALVVNQKDAPGSLAGDDGGATRSSYMQVNNGRPLLNYLNATDFTQPMVEDTKDPETDSLSYIRLLLEALHNLGHLSTAISSLNQRLPVELFKLVDKTNNEVDQRHPSSLTSMKHAGRHKKVMDLGLNENDVRVTIIHDLLCTLYAKFEAMMEGYRVIYDVIKGITKRSDNLQEAESWNNGFVEVWQLVQSEMRSLLHDYLTQNDSRGAHSGVPKNNAITNIVSGKLNRDKNKIIFKLSNTNANTTNGLKEDQDDLQQILKASVPGLVSESLRPAVSSSDNSNVSDGAATGHKLLIEPSVFNIGLLLPPSLAFLNRIKEIVPAGSGIVLSTLPSFLDDFLVNVFYPSLEDTIRDLFNQTIADLDSFHENPDWPSLSRKPVMKGTTAFLDLITAFCKMLDTIPPDQQFGQLTIDLLTTYYDRCFEWYKELIARHQSDETKSDVKASAKWAQHEPVRQTIAAAWNSDESSDVPLLLQNETEIEMHEYECNKFGSSDLISDRKAINSLCILCTSMRWLANKVVQLRHIEDPGNFSRNDGGSSGRLRRRWTLIDAVGARSDECKPVYLPMTAETVGAFDGVVTSFEELATTVLFTLHAEARCRIIYHLDKCITEGNHCLDNPVPTPDANVLALSMDLVWFDEDISSGLPEKEKEFIERGMGALMNYIFVYKASAIKILNMDGVDRIQINILVLQQNLKNIEPLAELSRASRFYSLYGGGMVDLIANAKAGKLDFTYDELKIIMELYFSEAMNNRRESSSALQAKRSLNENLLALSEIMWSL